MHTVRLSTMNASVATNQMSVLSTVPVQWGPMNKFEQVSSDNHQMALIGDQNQGVPCLMSGGGDWGSPCPISSRGYG